MGWFSSIVSLMIPMANASWPSHFAFPLWSTVFIFWWVVCFFRAPALIFKKNWTRNIKNKCHALSWLALNTCTKILTWKFSEKKPTYLLPWPKKSLQPRNSWVQVHFSIIYRAISTSMRCELATRGYSGSRRCPIKVDIVQYIPWSNSVYLQLMNFSAVTIFLSRVVLCIPFMDWLSSGRLMHKQFALVCNIIDILLFAFGSFLADMASEGTVFLLFGVAVALSHIAVVDSCPSGLVFPACAGFTISHSRVKPATQQCKSNGFFPGYSIPTTDLIPYQSGDGGFVYTFSRSDYNSQTANQPIRGKKQLLPLFQNCASVWLPLGGEGWGVVRFKRLTVHINHRRKSYFLEYPIVP